MLEARKGLQLMEDWEKCFILVVASCVPHLFLYKANNKCKLIGN